MGVLLVLEYHDNVTYYMANYFEFDINFEIISFQLHHIRKFVIVFKDLELVFIAMILKLKIYIYIREYFYFYL